MRIPAAFICSLSVIGFPPAIPAPGLLALAQGVEDVAGGLKRHARDTQEWPADHLGESLAMLSQAVRYVADSRPRSNLEGMRRVLPPEHSLQQEPVEPMHPACPELASSGDDVERRIAVGALPPLPSNEPRESERDEAHQDDREPEKDEQR